MTNCSSWLLFFKWYLLASFCRIAWRLCSASVKSWITCRVTLMIGCSDIAHILLKGYLTHPFDQSLIVGPSWHVTCYPEDRHSYQMLLYWTRENLSFSQYCQLIGTNMFDIPRTIKSVWFHFISMVFVKIGLSNHVFHSWNCEPAQE